MKTCAIIMTAYKSQETIIEAIESLKKQQLPDNWKMEFYIGVDSCQETALCLDKNNVSYYYTTENVGTYVLTNSLLAIAKDKSDVFVRFDSDDVACNDFLYNGIMCTENSGFSRAIRSTCDISLNLLEEGKYRKSYGVVFFNKEVLEKLGGYHNYRVGCDKFFVLRAQALGYSKNKRMPKPTFLYRTGSDSLTSNKYTGKNSEYRANAAKEMQELLDNKEYFVNPVTTSLVYHSSC